MDSISFNKNNFDMESFNTTVEKYCKEQSVSEETALNIRLVTEEFLSNFLFPNFSGDVNCSIAKDNENLTLSFEYDGANFMNRINTQTILSQKILHNKTKEIISDESDNHTVVKFVL